MTHKGSSSLHVEWAPGSIRVLNPITGHIDTAAEFTGLNGRLAGHKRVLVGIARNHVFVRLIRLPRASSSDLRLLVTAQLARLMPLPPGDLVFDVIQTADKDADGYLTLVAAMRTADLRQLATELKSAGLTAMRVLPIALAAPEVAEAAGKQDAVLVDTAGPGAAIDIVTGGVLRLSRATAAGIDLDTEVQRTVAAAGATGHPVVDAGTGSAGTCLQALDQVQHFHFELPEEKAKRALRKRLAGVRMATLAAGCAICFATAAWLDRGGAMAKVDQVERGNNTQINGLKKKQAMESALVKQGSERQLVLATAFEPAQTVSEVVQFVGDELPAGAWLTGLTVERGKSIQIRGAATDSNAVARYVSALGMNPRLTEARLVSANSVKVGKQPVVQFSIVAVVAGDSPMPTPTRGKSKAKKAAAAGTGGGQ